MPPTWIAETFVVFVRPNGARAEGRIAVGLPVQHVDHASCTVALEGLERSYAIYGADTLQALLLAVRFAGARFHDVLSRGVRVLHTPEDADGSADVDVDLGALFGPLLRGQQPLHGDPSTDE